MFKTFRFSHWPGRQYSKNDDSALQSQWEARACKANERPELARPMRGPSLQGQWEARSQWKACLSRAQWLNGLKQSVSNIHAILILNIRILKLKTYCAFWQKKLLCPLLLYSMSVLFSWLISFFLGRVWRTYLGSSSVTSRICDLKDLQGDQKY